MSCYSSSFEDRALGSRTTRKIRAREKGEQTMTMVYKRPWETGGAIEKKEFIVKVE